MSLPYYWDASVLQNRTSPTQDNNWSLIQGCSLVSAPNKMF